MFKSQKRARFLHVLKNKNFVFLWLDQLMSQIGDRFLLYVLLVLAYKLSGTNLGVSVPMLAFGFSAILFGPSAGVFVDRWDKKKVMVFSNLIRGCLILLIIPFINQSLWIVFFISFVIFSVSQFFAPAETASIPMLVEKRDLIAANSLFMMSLMAASVIGIGLAAPLANFFGVKIVLVIAASLHLSSTLATLMLSMKHREKKMDESVGGLIKDLRMGLEYIRRKNSIKGALIKLFFATSVLAAVSMMSVKFSEKVLGIGAANFGYLVISAGAGMVAGGFFLGHSGHWFKKNRLAQAGFFLAGGALIVLSQARDISIALTSIFFLGVGNSFIVAPLQTVLHEKVPRLIRGRVFGVQNMFINSAFTFPVIVLGEVADIFGLQTIMFLLGAFVLVGGLLELCFSLKEKNRA